jgi:hypothetical protein
VLLEEKQEKGIAVATRSTAGPWDRVVTTKTLSIPWSILAVTVARCDDMCMAGQQPEGRSEASRTDFAELAREAHARAQAAAERAEALRAARQVRIQRRDDGPDSSTDTSLAVARRRADEARRRLIAALMRSATAHERAAEVLETSVPTYPALAGQVRHHRMAAAADRARAEHLACNSAPPE